MANKNPEATDFRPVNKKNNSDNSEMGKVAVTAGIAAAAGFAAPFAAEAATGLDVTAELEDNDAPATASSHHAAAASHPELVPDVATLASGVNDNMTFAQAFAAARAEVGPGGVFHWHGNTYGTYYADEWEIMSDADRQEFAQHASATAAEHPAPAWHAQSQEQIAQNEVEPANVDVVDPLPAVTAEGDDDDDLIVEVLDAEDVVGEGTEPVGGDLDGLPDYIGPDLDDNLTADADICGDGDCIDDDLIM